MAKQNLLLVDADLRSVRVLEVSLRKAGYNVASAGNAKDALAMLELSRPDLVLCDTRLPTMDGFELIQELRRSPELAGIPLMILSSDVSVETKVRGLELGIEDYLTKPIYIKELLARVNIVLQRKRREGIERLEHGHKRKFSGSLSDMGVVDLLQAIDHNKKSGVLYLTSGSFEGAIYFCNGAPVDAAVGRLRGSRAIYRSLLWTEGTFEIDFREIDREDHVQSSMQAVLMEGLRRVDEWGRLLEQLPNLETVFDVSDTQLMARLAEIPDQINSVLREFDGQRSLWEIVDACDADDLETLNAVSKLYFEGLLYNTGRRPGDADALEDAAESMSELSDMALPHISSGPPVITHTLAPSWGSVPSDDGSESQLVDDTLQLNIPATPRLPEGLRVTPSEAPKRRKARKRKKRSGQSLPAPGDTTRKHAKPAKAKAKADEAEVRVVDETVAEITPSTIAPPPEEAENAALMQPEQAEQADATTVVVPGTSKPPQLPRSFGAGTAPGEFPRATQTAIHENPTLDLSPIIRSATPPPLRSAHPPFSAAPEGGARAPALKSTAPPPLSAEAELPDAAPDFLNDEETTEKQVSLRGSIPPPAVESYVPRKAASPPPLPYVSKPPGPGFGSPRGVTSQGFAAAPVDAETLAAAAAISEVETAPPPLAAEQRPPKIFAGAAMRGSHLDAFPQGSVPPALRSGSPLPRRDDADIAARGASRAPEADARASDAPSLPPSAGRGTAWESVSQRPRALASEVEGDESASSVTRTSPAPYPASIPARDFEAAILASIAPPAAESDDSQLLTAGNDDHPHSVAAPSSGSSTLPEQHLLSEAEGLRSAASVDLSAPPGSASQSPAELEDSFAAASRSEISSELGAPSSTEASTSPDQVDSGKARDGTSASPRVDSTLESVAPEQREGSTRAEVSSTDARELSSPARGSVASDDPQGASVPASFSEHSDSSSAGPRAASRSPSAAASIPPDERDDAATADSRSEAGNIASAQPDGVSAPPLAAASVLPDHDDAATTPSHNEASRVASARPGGASIPSLAAATHAASARPSGASIPSLPAASISPAARDSAAASRSEAPSVASALSGDVSVPPLAAASAPPDEHDDAATAASRSEAPSVASARPGDGGVPPLAAASVPPNEREDSENAASRGEGSEASARPSDFSASPIAAASVPPDPHEGSEHAVSRGEDSEASARPSDFSAPPSAAASVPPDEREDSENAASRGEDSEALSARPSDFSTPPIAAASVPPDEREGSENAASRGEDYEASARPSDFSASPIAAASVPPDLREGSENAASRGEDYEASARPSDFSAPPIAAASVPSGKHEDSEAADARGAASDALSARPLDFGHGTEAGASLLPVGRESTATSVSAGEAPDSSALGPSDLSEPPPGEHEDPETAALRAEVSDVLSAQSRDFSAPPTAADSVSPDEREGSEPDATRGNRPDGLPERGRDLSAPPMATASVRPRDDEDSEAAFALGDGSGLLEAQAFSRASSEPRELDVPPLVAASDPPEQMDEEQRAFSSRTLIEGRDFAVPALAAASLPPGVMADPSDAELVQPSLPPLASSAPANDVGESQKPEEDFSDLALNDERSSSGSAAASQERASPPPLPSTGRRSNTPRMRTSPPPLPYSRARAEAEARQFGAPPPLATATEPPPGAAALSSPLPPSVDTHTAPGGYVAISPEDDADDTSKRIRAPQQRTAVPPPFAPDAATPNASAEVDAGAEREPSRGVELAANSEPPRISAVASSVRPDSSERSESAADDASALNEPSAAWLRDASARVDTEGRESSAATAREEARDEAENRDRSERQLADAGADQGAAKRDSAQTSVATARGDVSSLAAKPPDAAHSATSKTGDPASTASGRPLGSAQRPQKTSNVISFVPRKRAEDASASASGAPADPQKTADAAAALKSLPARGTSQGVWGSTSGAPAAGNAPSQVAPQQKRRISRWVQAGGAAATVALAAGLFALRARDAAPQGSLNSAVPDVVETPAVVPPKAATDGKQQALGELEALHKQAQALPEAQPQATPQPSAAAPTTTPAAQVTGATATAPAGAAPQQAAAAEPAKPQQAATAEPAQQPPAAEEQAAKAASNAQPQTPSESQSNAAQALAKGRSLEQRGKKQDAINLYTKAVEDGNASSQLLSRMAFLYLNQGKNALAEAAAKRAADADETNSEAWIVLGAALDGLGKKPAAEQAYRSCALKGQGQYVTECKRMLR